jgi:hypothetical protein
MLLYPGELYRLLGASSYGYVLGISTAMALLKTGSINCRGLSSDKIKRRDIFLKCRQNMMFLFYLICIVKMKLNHTGDQNGVTI